MYKASFVLEDWFGPYLGHTDGERWNGWATPYFEYDVGLKMVEDWKASEFEDMEAYYDVDNDQFCFRSEDDEDWERFPSVTRAVGSEMRKLYPIGAFCWIWSEGNKS